MVAAFMKTCFRNEQHGSLHRWLTLRCTGSTHHTQVEQALQCPVQWYLGSLVTLQRLLLMLAEEVITTDLRKPLIPLHALSRKK